MREGERQVEAIRQSGGQPRRLAVRGRFKTTVGRHRSGSLASCPAPRLTRRRVPRELREASGRAGSVLSPDSGSEAGRGAPPGWSACSGESRRRGAGPSMSLPPEKASELKQLIHQQLSKVRGHGPPRPAVWPRVCVPRPGGGGGGGGPCLPGTRARVLRRRARAGRSFGAKRRTLPAATEREF